MIPLNTSFLEGTLRFLCPSEFLEDRGIKFGVSESSLAFFVSVLRAGIPEKLLGVESWFVYLIDMKGGLGSCDWGGQEVPRSPVCKGESWECLQAPGEPLLCDLSRVWRSQDHESWCWSQEKESALVVFLLQWSNTVAKNHLGKKGFNLLLFPHLSSS